MRSSVRPLIICVLVLMGFIHPLAAEDHGHDHPIETSHAVPWYTESALFSLMFEEKQWVDTTLTAFQRYAFHQRPDRLYAGKGNTGQPVRSLLFAPRWNRGFTLFPYDIYPGYLHDLDQVRYYRPAHVFSELYYVLGSQSEQLFYARHNQRFHEHVYGGINYQTVNSPGMYSRLEARNANLLLYVDAEPLDRYQVAGSFMINRIINQESGGLVDPAGFEEDEARDEVYLYNAVSRRRELGIRLQQSYQPGWYRNSDTLAEPGFRHLGRLRHSITYKRQAFVFDEASTPSTHFYPDEFRSNEMMTYDSTVVHTLSNHLGWSTGLPGTTTDFPLHVHAYLQHELINVDQPLLRESSGDEYPFLRDRYAQLRPGLALRSDPDAFFSFDGQAHYTFGGYNDRDHMIGGGLSIGDHSLPLRLRLQGSWREYQSPYFFRRTRSNYVIWFNDLEKSRVFHGGAQLEHGIFTLQGNYYRLHRPVFLDQEAYPIQPGEWIPVLTAGLSARIDAGILHTRHQVHYQHVAEDLFERFPRWLSYHSVYADFILFGGALHAHTGIDLRYNAPYRPMAYMPMVRQFYLQDDYESRHEFLLDVFVNAKISRARLFVKFEHLLGLLTERTPVYDTPYYPLPEGMFKFGVSWMFFN